MDEEKGLIPQKPNIKDSVRRSRIEALIAVCENVSQVTPTLEADLREVMGDEYEARVIQEGDVFIVKSSPEDIIARYRFLTDEDGRVIKKLDAFFYRFETFEYDESGYLIEHAVRFINNYPSGWVRRFKFETLPLGGKRLVKLTFQKYQINTDSSELNERASQDNPGSMYREISRGKRVIVDSFSLFPATQGLEKVEEEIVATFTNGQPNEAVFIGFMSL